MGPSTEVKSPQVQYALPRMLGEIRRPDHVELRLLKQCRSMLEAVHLCIQMSRGLKHYALADALGIDRGHWTRMMTGHAHFPLNKLSDLMARCGNYAPLQWLAIDNGQDIAINQRALRVQQLRAELAELEVAA